MSQRFDTRARELFDAAAAKGLSERSIFLDRACAADPELRAFVDAMVGANDSAAANGFLTDGAAACATAPAGSARSGLEQFIERVGFRVGPYRLLRLVGEGGFGTVFLAEQEHPVRRRVALKLIKPGMDSRQVVARFEAERRALARMDHPNIARVFEAGATESGRPYFVMELVGGVPITDFCDAGRLNLRERLDLFVQVCRAVQHAHHKGIIHRDLKPSNILVSVADGAAVPKIIDFGIAKAVAGAPLINNLLLTECRQFVGTPQYMSPEQAGLNGLDVDTRSDIYSLGCLLHELLTGVPPFDTAAGKDRPYDELLRLVREADLPAPSAWLTRSRAGVEEVAMRRRADPRRLRKQVTGALDWVVMKCLEKDRARRYETASALAQDVLRYLGGWPVLARPTGPAYRLMRFVGRHKAAVAVLSTSVVLLVVGTIGTTTGLVRARRAQQVAEEERAKARTAASAALLQSEEAHKARTAAEAAGVRTQRLSNFYSRVLGSARPAAEGGGAAARVIDLLRFGSPQIEKDLAADPGAQGYAFTVFGEAFRRLGFYADAERDLRRAYSEFIVSQGAESEITLSIAAELTAVRAKLIAAGAAPAEGLAAAEADAVARDAAQMAAKKLGEAHPVALDTAAAHAQLLLARGDKTAGASALVTLLRQMARGMGAAPAGAAPTAGASVESTAVQSLGLRVAAAPKAVAGGGREIPWSERQQFSFHVLLAPTPGAADAALGGAHRRADRVATYARDLAATYKSNYEPKKAEACLRDAIAAAVNGGIVDATLRAGLALDLASILVQTNRPDDANKLFRYALNELDARLGRAHPETEAAVDTYADALEQQGLHSEALYERLAQLEASASEGPPDGREQVARRIVKTGLLRLHCGMPEQGDRLVAEALTMISGRGEPGSTAAAGVGTGDVRRRQQATDPAQTWWRQWMLLRGVGNVGWKSEALRTETWLLLEASLRDQHPDTLTRDGVRWTTFRFRLHRWHGAGAPASAAEAPSEALEHAVAASGDLEALKQLRDPTPGVYLYSVEVETDAGMVRDARWLLFAPWRLAFCALNGDRAGLASEWRQGLAVAPTNGRAAACLSFDSSTRCRNAGPDGRWGSFGVVAEAPLALVPGTYHLTFEADDGVRAWAREAPTDGDAGNTSPPAGAAAPVGAHGWRTLAAAWNGEGRRTRHAAVQAGASQQSLRIEYFQWQDDYALNVRCQPDSPAADAWVAAVLGTNSRGMVRWLSREGALLEAVGRDRDARAKYERALALVRQIGPGGACDEADLLAGVGRASAHLGDERRAVESFQESLRVRSAAIGPDHKDTLVAALEAGRALGSSGDADAQALRRSAAADNARKLDEEIEAANVILRAYPRDLRSLLQRFDLHGRRGMLHEAGDDIDALLQLGDFDVDLYYRGGVVRLASGDQAAYRRHCVEIFNRYGRSLQTGAMRRVVKTCCLVPDPVGGPSAMLKIATNMHKAEPNSFWSVQVLALAQYRAGNYEEAAKLLRPERHDMGAGSAASDALLALTLYRCGDEAAARERLGAVRRAMAEAIPDGAPTALATGWHDWLVCRILADEAEALIRTAGSGTARWPP